MSTGAYKFLALVGAAIFTFSGLVTWLTYWDWVPRTCTLAGCPSPYSIEVIYSYTVHGGYSILLMDLVGLAIVLGGLRLTRAIRTRDRLLPVLVGIVISIIIFFAIAYVTLTTSATVTSMNTVTTATTTRG